MSIYQTILENLNEEGRLPPNYELPHPPIKEGQIKYEVGASDGAAAFHGFKKSQKFVSRLLKAFKAGDMEKIPAIIKDTKVINFIDSLTDALYDEFEHLDADILYSYAMSLAFESEEEELVKLGIALLGIFEYDGDDDTLQKLITLGLYEEFTLYVVVAADVWDFGNQVIFHLAKNTDGWGKIHAVRNLEPNTQEIRLWCLTSGCKNTVMDSVLAWDCANKGKLQKALKQDELSPELFEGISTIILGLFEEDPLTGISALPNAGKALLRYLHHAQKHASTVKDLYRIAKIQHLLPEKNLKDTDQIIAKCKEISSWEIWKDKILEALKGEDDSFLFYAAYAARCLNLDISQALFEAVYSDPLRHSFAIIDTFDTSEHARKMTELLEEILPLKEMASGPAAWSFPQEFINEHLVNEDAVLCLKDYPLLGKELIKAALLSPVVSERNIACITLQSWSESLLQSVQEFAPDLYEVLLALSKAEPNERTKAEVMNLLRLQDEPQSVLN
ncbi:MAG: hypothetical protein LBR25_06645 [Erysipelotrichaceae bacterium]|jgi:hypothetical protein|nr:hypothetical protein [Erysipelotrichaceae bacterium]